MEVIFHIVLVCHILCWAFVLGGSVVSIKSAVFPRGMVHASIGALLTGLILALMAFSATTLGKDPDHVKLAIKLVIALVVAATVFLCDRKKEWTKPWVIGGVASLTALNIAIAVLWT